MTTQRIRHYIRSRTGRLALTYLAIIMAMTVLFSSIIFTVASRQFDRPLNGRGGPAMMGEPETIRTLLDQRAADARAELLLSLLLLNLGMLGFGVWFSHYLAERTMQPIERAMKEQEQFVSDASHELRTPLTALSTLNEVALRRKTKISDSEARDLAAKNAAETAKLYHLTSSLLGLVHTNQNTPAISSVDLQQVVSDAMEHITAAAQDKSMTIEDIVPRVKVLTSADRLAQVVKVLLENAVKYSHNRGTVEVRTATHGSTLTLSVVDHGIGIAEADMPHIFNRFYRVDQSRSKAKHDGYGIGLAIAKAISDQLHMNLSVESTPGEGSVFSVDLPLAKAE